MYIPWTRKRRHAYTYSGRARSLHIYISPSPSLLVTCSPTAHPPESMEMAGRLCKPGASNSVYTFQSIAVRQPKLQYCRVYINSPLRYIHATQCIITSVLYSTSKPNFFLKRAITGEKLRHQNEYVHHHASSESALLSKKYSQCVCNRRRALPPGFPHRADEMAHLGWGEGRTRTRFCTTKQALGKNGADAGATISLIAREPRGKAPASTA